MLVGLFIILNNVTLLTYIVKDIYYACCFTLLFTIDLHLASAFAHAVRLHNRTVSLIVYTCMIVPWSSFHQIIFTE